MSTVKFNLTVESYDHQFGTFAVTLSNGEDGWVKRTLIPEEIINIVVGVPGCASLLGRTFTIENPHL